MFSDLAWVSLQLKTFMDANLGIWYYIILNAFGVIAIILKVIEVQLNNRKIILLFAIFAASGWTIYFGLNFDFASAISCFLSIVQLIVFSMRGKYKWADSIFWLFFFIVLRLGLGILTFSSWKSIAPLVAGILGVIAYFVMDERKYRFFVLSYSIFWLMNSISNLYIVALLSDSFCLISAIVAIIRYNVLGKRKQKEKNDSIDTAQIERVND